MLAGAARGETGSKGGGGRVRLSDVDILNLCDAHRIVTESRLNLPNGFHQADAQF